MSINFWYIYRSYFWFRSRQDYIDNFFQRNRGYIRNNRLQIHLIAKHFHKFLHLDISLDCHMDSSYNRCQKSHFCSSNTIQQANLLNSMGLLYKRHLSYCMFLLFDHLPDIELRPIVAQISRKCHWILSLLWKQTKISTKTLYKKKYDVFSSNKKIKI